MSIFSDTWVCTYHDGTVLTGDRSKFGDLERHKVARFRVMNWSTDTLPLGYARRSKITTGRGVTEVCHIVVLLNHVLFLFESNKSVVRRETFDAKNPWFRPIQYKCPFFFP